MKILLILLFLLSSCVVNEQYEDYGLETSADLVLSESNHTHGYKQANCFYCHVKSSIHVVNTLGNPLFDLARQKTETEGISSCSLCHGNNGVTP